MKKIFFAIPVIAIMAVSCNSHEKEIVQLNTTVDSLRSVTEMRDSVLGDFLITFNEIETNLDSIAYMQNKIEGTMDKHGELNISKKDKINNDIATISQLVKQNRSNIAELQKKLKRSNSKNSELIKTIAGLNEQLIVKEADLAQLNLRLEGLNMEVVQLKTTVDTLTNISTAQAGTIEEQTKQIHTAYYVLGTSKELLNKNIIKKTGGVLGVGKTSQMKDQFNPQDFTMIDYTQTLTIPINNDGIKVLSTHPGSSFTIEKNKDGKVTDIKISDPESFWSISKYLVMVSE